LRAAGGRSENPGVGGSIPSLPTISRRRLCAVEGGESLGPFPEHRLVDDGVSPIDRLGAVTDHGHGGRAQGASALKISDPGTAKVVRNPKRVDDLSAVLLHDARQASAGHAVIHARVGVVEVSPGMEFIADLRIEQHFAERGRIGQLLSAVAQYPHDLGIGKNTALVVRSRSAR